jgi:NADH:ubiquinone oxidoreductase subunit F (NADH-binding)
VPETRVVLRNCGLIDPRDINTYIARDGFRGLEKALSLTPEQVIEELKGSGLRGRGGAFFPAGMKLEMARKAPGDEKYVICNADEGEVGTFKDRYLIQNDPFTLVEGVAIAAHAVGSKQAFIYLRAEYHYLLATLQGAVDQARDRGYLKHADITVREGAGAYVCGEESALMDSIEGKRGEARYRPPFPTNAGLWQKPTTINNVETMSNLPQILLNGAAWFNQMGTERSKGTKVFSLSGDVAHPGVYELLLGTPLKELVVDLGGAMSVKAVQIGGTCGRIVPGTNLGIALATEAVLGSGAVTVFDDSRDIVDIMYRTQEFLAEESCGKCFPCREGTQNLTGILGKFVRGEGSPGDLKLLEDLSKTMMLASSCGLGQAAPTGLMDSLQHFRPDFEKRVRAR